MNTTLFVLILVLSAGLVFVLLLIGILVYLSIKLVRRVSDVARSSQKMAPFLTLGFVFDLIRKLRRVKG